MVDPMQGRRAAGWSDLLYFTTYLRTAETKDYVALARDVDLRSIVPNAAVVAEIPRCGS
jgi:hypothetical protein